MRSHWPILTLSHVHWMALRGWLQSVLKFSTTHWQSIFTWVSAQSTCPYADILPVFFDKCMYKVGFCCSFNKWSSYKFCVGRTNILILHICITVMPSWEQSTITLTHEAKKQLALLHYISVPFFTYLYVWTNAPLLQHNNTVTTIEII